MRGPNLFRKPRTANTPARPDLTCAHNTTEFAKLCKRVYDRTSCGQPKSIHRTTGNRNFNFTIFDRTQDSALRLIVAIGVLHIA